MLLPIGANGYTSSAPSVSGTMLSFFDRDLVAVSCNVTWPFSATSGPFCRFTDRFSLLVLELLYCVDLLPDIQVTMLQNTGRIAIGVTMHIMTHRSGHAAIDNNQAKNITQHTTTMAIMASSSSMLHPMVDSYYVSADECSCTSGSTFQEWCMPMSVFNTAVKANVGSERRLQWWQTTRYCNSTMLYAFGEYIQMLR